MWRVLNRLWYHIYSQTGLLIGLLGPDYVHRLVYVNGSGMMPLMWGTYSGAHVLCIFTIVRMGVSKVSVCAHENCVWMLTILKDASFQIVSVGTVPTRRRNHIWRVRLHLLTVFSLRIYISKLPQNDWAENTSNIMLSCMAFKLPSVFLELHFKLYGTLMHGT